MSRTVVLLAAMLSCLIIGSVQSQVISSFECPASQTNPSCEGWVSSFGVHTIVQTPGCLGMPSDGARFLEIASGSSPASPAWPLGSVTPMYPFTAGVSEISKTIVASQATIELDYIWATGGNTAFFEILAVDPMTNAVLGVFALGDGTTTPLLSGACTPTFGVPPNMSTGAAQTVSVTLPLSHVGSPVKIVALAGETANILIGPAAFLFVDNVRYGAPAPATGLRFAPGATLVLNPATGFFNMSATVAAIERSDGTVDDDPTSDPVIGAAVNFNGAYTGAPSPTNLSGAVFGPFTGTISTGAASDAISFATILAQGGSAAPDRSGLGGSLGCQPFIRRALANTVIAPPVRIGTGSIALDDLALLGIFQGVTLHIDELAGAPLAPAAIRFGYVFPPATPEVNACTDGFGSFEIGLINIPVNEDIYNVVVPFPSVPVGTGPFYGVETPPIVTDIVTSPLGTVPFHVAPSAAGTYYFAVPLGALASGLVLDVVSGSVPPGSGTPSWVSPVQRLVF